VKIGAWVHTMDDLALEQQLVQVAESGLTTIRCYHYAYAQEAAPALRHAGMSLLAGMHVDAQELVRDWRSQVRLDELAQYHELGVPLEAICVGNELRDGGDEPDKKRFTARLSFGLANVLAAYRRWLDERGIDTPLTYAMEGIVFDRNGQFHEWLWPLVDVCDVVSLNAYPMGEAAWFTFGAFEESRRFLDPVDARARNDRLAQFDLHLRRVLQALEAAGKPLILSETGFPSAVGYHREGERLIVPESDNVQYGRVMKRFVGLIRQANDDYGGRIQAIYFYEWWDNLHHSKIWNVEQSPIHTAFGLCDRFAVEKFDLKEIL
jgi:hypothetical protein